MTRAGVLAACAAAVTVLLTLVILARVILAPEAPPTFDGLSLAAVVALAVAVAAGVVASREN